MATKNFYAPSQVVPYQSDFTATEIPRFAGIPTDSVNCIVSPSGLTYLPKSKFKSVFMGSKYHAVDCHGIPWMKKTELKKVMSGEPVKKKAPVETEADSIKKLSSLTLLQMSNYFSTRFPKDGAGSTKLSTKQKGYKVKKSLVRSRLMAYTRTKKGCRHLYFFTVTFPSGMPDNAGYKCLNNWFTALRKQNLIREYLWVAERQENGTIHFHIAVPHFMKVVHVNGIMRLILRRYAVKKEIPFSPAQFDPKKYNGVDIQGWWPSGVRYKGPKIATNFAEKKHSGALVRYLTKYITKNNGTFEHLAWHNSRGFSAVFYAVALSRYQVHAAGLFHYAVPSHSEKIFFKYGEFGPLGKDGTGRDPDLEMVFVPWKREAPDKFWDVVSTVNNFFQDMTDNTKYKK